MKRHYIKKGDKISHWISSFYYLGREGDYHGVYCRFWGIIFESDGALSGKTGKFVSEEARKVIHYP